MYVAADLLYGATAYSHHYCFKPVHPFVFIVWCKKPRQRTSDAIDLKQKGQPAYKKNPNSPFMD